jgi:hypothetical protein
VNIVPLPRDRVCPWRQPPRTEILPDPTYEVVPLGASDVRLLRAAGLA